MKLSRLAAAGGLAGPVLFTLAWVASSLRQAGHSAAEVQLSGLAAEDARDPQIMMAGFVLLGAGYSAYTLPMGVAAFVIGTVAWTAAEIIAGPTMFAYPGLVAPDHLRARYIGATQVMFSLGGVIGPTLGVASYAAFGDRTWLLSGVLSLLALAAALGGMTTTRSTDEPVTA